MTNIVLVIVFTICFSEVHGVRYDQYSTLEQFLKISVKNDLEKLQEDSLIVVSLLADVPNRIFPFIRSFFGYNRMKIRKEVNNILTQIDKMTNGGTQKNTCIDDNKKILTLIFNSAVSDWTCFKSKVTRFFQLIRDIWETIFDFTLVSDHESSCLIPILCTGFNTAKLTAQLAIHGAKFVAFGAGFIIGIKSCQKDVSKFKTEADKVLDVMKSCMKKS